MALIFGPKAHFFGADCGRLPEYESGIIPFSRLHYLFGTYCKDLVPRGTEKESKTVISFFKELGICREIAKEEAKALHFITSEKIYEFPDLCQISDLHILPSEIGIENHKTLCFRFKKMTQHDFSKIRQNLASVKDPNYKSFR